MANCHSIVTGLDFFGCRLEIRPRKGGKVPKGHQLIVGSKSTPEGRKIPQNQYGWHRFLDVIRITISFTLSGTACRE